MTLVDRGSDARERAEASVDVERRRQGSVVLYGLTRESAPGGWPEMEEVVHLARDGTGAGAAALTILDDDLQIVAAATPGVPTHPLPRESSVCGRMLRLSDGPGVQQVEDLLLVEGLADVGGVSGGDTVVRSYAGAPLLGQEGLALGMLCVWSGTPRLLTDEQSALLAALRLTAVHLLDERRRGRQLHPVLPSELPSVEAVVEATVESAVEVTHDRARPPDAVGAPADIDAIIDERAVRTLWQSVIQLSTGNVVGFEALSRGPEGTALEAPNALLEAARNAGRLGELDWVCRSVAAKVALASGLPQSLSWFMNVEAAGLAHPCPADLQATQTRAQSDLRVVLELTERDTDGYVRHLLQAADQARRSTWGVSLDDVGTGAMSLALLPFLQPDVVKLDMRLITRLPPATLASVTAAVHAYAERSGAVILAESVETRRHERLAVLFGATYAQGYLYGRPGPLPASVPVPRQPIPLRQVVPPDTGETPFELASAERPSVRADRDHLLHISEHLERQGHLATEESVLLACVQRARYFDERRQAEFREHAVVNAFTMVSGTGLVEQLTPRYRMARLDDDNRMAREWVVIVLGPHFCAALLARECGGEKPDGEFDVVYTHDRGLVVRASRSFLRQSDNPATSDPSHAQARQVEPAQVEPVQAAPPAVGDTRLVGRRWGLRSPGRR